MSYASNHSCSEPISVMECPEDAISQKSLSPSGSYTVSVPSSPMYPVAYKHALYRQPVQN